MLAKVSREGWSWKSFIVALRSKSYDKDWEQTARPAGTRPNNYK